MVFKFLSFELILFIGILCFLLKLRNSSALSLKLVNGLTIYLPPHDADFEILEKTDKKVRTNMKGEPKKFDKSKANRKPQIPLRSMEISPELLRYNQEFFEVYDFVILMFLVSIIMFVLTTSLSVTPLSFIEPLNKTNLTFYIMLVVLSFIFQNLAKNTFNLGYFRYTAETKMEFMMACKAFFIIFLTFRSVNTKLLFDFDLNVLHQDFNNHLNQALAPFRIGGRDIPVDFSVFVFALIGSLISFAIVRIQVKFAYYYYCYTA